MSLPEIKRKLKCLCDDIKQVASNLSGLTDKINSQTINIYRLAEGESGVRNREWHDTAPVVPISASTTEAGRNFRLSHDFSLPVDTATTLANLNLNDTNNTAGELDIQVLDTVITVPVGGIWVRYTGGSEGYWAIEVGQCCGPLELRAELGYSDRLDNTAEVGPVFLPEGQHNFRAWNIDSGGTNSSHTVSYSTDGTTFTTALPDGTTLTLGKREIECEQHLECDPVPEGWSRCEPTSCGAAPVDPLPELPIVFPDQEICDGSFVQRTGRTGWLFPWTPVATANTGTIEDDWVQVSTTETSPDCVTDLEVNVFAGNHYFQIDSARIYHWIDFRLLVNGVAVLTETFDHYEYLDDRNETVDTTNPQKLIIRTGGSWFAERKNVPAGATVSVEMRRRYNFNAFQTGGRARAIGGLRSKALFDFSPQQIVTGRV